MVTDDQILEAVHDLLVDKTSATETFKYRTKPIIGENQSPFINIVTGPRGYKPDNSRAASKVRHTLTIIILVEGEEESDADTFSSFVINQLDTIESQISDILDLYNDNWGLSEVMSAELTGVQTERENPDKNRTYAARYLTYEIVSKKIKKDKPKLLVPEIPKILISDLENWSDSEFTLLADQTKNSAIYKESERATYLVGSGAHQNIYKIQLPDFTISLVGALPFVLNNVEYIWIVDKWVALNFSTTGGFGTDIAVSNGSDLTAWTKEGNAINAGAHWVPFLANDKDGNLRIFLSGGSPEEYRGLMSALVTGDAYLNPANWTNHGQILLDEVYYGSHVDVTPTHVYVYAWSKVLKGDLTDLSIAGSWSVVSSYQYDQYSGFSATNEIGEVYKVNGQSLGNPSAVGGRVDSIQKATNKDSPLFIVEDKIYPWKTNTFAHFIDHISKEAYGCGGDIVGTQRAVGKSGTKTI